MTQLQGLSSQPPPPEVASRMEGVFWVQKFGAVTFNHVTGAVQTSPGATDVLKGFQRDPGRHGSKHMLVLPW
eukprot:Skav220716  [mRNA]  locus=scaffold1850:73834:74049:- [translate_table: standard]